MDAKARVARVAVSSGQTFVMGVGEDALGLHLAPEGWSLKPGVLAHFGKRLDLTSARKALLDTDLVRVGEPYRRCSGDTTLTGPVVLQVVSVTDVSQPQRRFESGDQSQTSTSSQRMLRVELTDGDARFVGVEHRLLTNVTNENAIPPGSKIAIPPGVTVTQKHGILLLKDRDLTPLGGRVSSLIEDWERRRAYEQSESESSSDVANSAPKFEPYDPNDTVAIKAAAAARQREATRVVNEAAAAQAAAAAKAKQIAETNNADTADDSAFVPRARPTLPQTKAQRLAAAAAGQVLPVPGAPIPQVVSVAVDAKGQEESTNKAPPAPLRAKPALPPRR
ncbi:RMI1 N-terminal domain-containing protein, partial [bacterium]|nr:RMI1 N-terminal domain-containing protein [bacterium]